MLRDTPSSAAMASSPLAGADEAEHLPGARRQVGQRGRLRPRFGGPAHACQTVENHVREPGGILHHRLDRPRHLDMRAPAIGDILRDEQDAALVADLNGLRRDQAVEHVTRLGAEREHHPSRMAMRRDDGGERSASLGIVP